MTADHPLIVQESTHHQTIQRNCICNSLCDQIIESYHKVRLIVLSDEKE